MFVIKNLSKEYPGVKAVDNVSFNLPNTGLIFLMGPSGSGKTTLINLLAGIDKPTSGQILIGDRDLVLMNNQEKQDYLNQFSSFIYQNIGLLNHLNIKDNFNLVTELTQNKNIEYDELFKTFDLDMAMLKRKPVEISGGQAQRMAIIKAVISNSNVIFADEPTSALDIDSSLRVMNYFKKIASNRLVVIVSHNKDLAYSFADIIISLEDGHIKETIKRTKELDYQKLLTENTQMLSSYFQSYELKIDNYNYLPKHKKSLSFTNSFKIITAVIKSRLAKSILSIIMAVMALVLFSAFAIMDLYNDLDVLLYSNKQNNIDFLQISDAFIMDDGINLGGWVNPRQNFTVASFNSLMSFFQSKNEPDPTILFEHRFSIFNTTSTNSIYNNGGIVWFQNEVNASNLKKFHGSSLLIGDFPNTSKNNLEIMISDILAWRLIGQNIRTGIRGTNNRIITSLYDLIGVELPSLTSSGQGSSWHNVAVSSAYAPHGSFGIIGNNLITYKIVGIYNTHHEELKQSLINSMGDVAGLVQFDFIINNRFNSIIMSNFAAHQTTPFFISNDSRTALSFVLQEYRFLPSLASRRTFLTINTNIDPDEIQGFVGAPGINPSMLLPQANYIIVPFAVYVNLLNLYRLNNPFISIPNNIADITVVQPLLIDIYCENNETLLAKNLIVVGVQATRTIVHPSVQQQLQITLNSQSARQVYIFDNFKYLSSLSDFMEANVLLFTHPQTADFRFIQRLFSMISPLIIYFFIFTIVFAIFIIIVNTSGIIKSMNKDVGVLRASGASLFDIFKIFLTNALIVGVGTFALSVALLPSTVKLLNFLLNFTFNTSITILFFQPLVVLYLGVVCMSLSIITIIVPVFSISQTAPIKIINKSR